MFLNWTHFCAVGLTALEWCAANARRVWGLPSFPIQCNVFRAWGVTLVGHCMCFLPLFPPPCILFLVVLIFQCRCITSRPMNSYIFVCQLEVSTLNNLPSVINSLAGASFSILKIFYTVSGIWNLDFFRYLIPPFCVSDQISQLHIITLEYIVAFLSFAADYHCIHLHPVTC